MELDDFRFPVVRLVDEDITGIVVIMGAHASTIVYYQGGHRYEVVVPNEDFEVVGHINFGHTIID